MDWDQYLTHTALDALIAVLVALVGCGALFVWGYLNRRRDV